MITRDLRHAIACAVAAAGSGQGNDPGLRATGLPGQYAASVALTLGGNPRETAQRLAAQLAEERWIDTAEVTGPGYLTITVTPETLAAVADSVTSEGPGCVTSDALAGTTVPAAPPGDPLAAPEWEEARAALAARLTARLAAAAGATVADLQDAERLAATRPASTDFRTEDGRTRYGDLESEPDAAAGLDERGARCERKVRRNFTNGNGGAEIAAAIAYAGRDAVLFTLARAIPGKPLLVEPEVIGKHVLGNPAYAVRYAHARAASGVRWATSSAADTIGLAEASALLDALSWLPERVAIAARRGRPDEFARYLEDLASATVDVLSFASHPRRGGPLVQKLILATAARIGLAVGLSLLEVSAPDRL